MNENIVQYFSSESVVGVLEIYKYFMYGPIEEPG
jgi:hypothetical protein